MTYKVPRLPGHQATLRRLRAVLMGIPGAEPGYSKSRTTEAMATTLQDNEIARVATVSVLAGLISRPHPLFNDAHEDAVARAAEDLVWLEAWYAWRNGNNWPPYTRRIDPLRGRPWEE